jgi:hypothetical protein
VWSGMLAGLLWLCEEEGILTGTSCSGAARLHEGESVKLRTDAAAAAQRHRVDAADRWPRVSLEQERSRSVTFDGGMKSTIVLRDPKARAEGCLR